jgi:rhamnose utilization protein RhaD (predicted bifunctional aldolase and dehydrogenase)/NAD(P)-dependent dehydrogenase (short-subunit alcohol dehydrogenase family)
MKSLWNAEDAASLVAHYGGMGYPAELALRIYSCRLLGSDPRLVQHGGGNTSVKMRERIVTGEDVAVIRVKGSGWNLDAIEPAGMPAMKLAALQELKSIPQMSDEAMVNAQRAALLDASAPTPSVETLLHAWVPHAVIDHTHANAVLAIVDQPDGENRARDMYADVLAICPYVMPGFALAQKVRSIVEVHPSAQGIVLLKHGIFTWGESAREAYERMIAMVTRAERAVDAASGGMTARTTGGPRQGEALAARVMPVLRGALAEDLGAGAWKRVVLDRRESPEIMRYLQHPRLQAISHRGPVTPDHVLRIKPWPLVLQGLAGMSDEELERRVRAAVNEFRLRYREYFGRNNQRVGGDRRALDATPRVVLAPELGLIGVGSRLGEAAIAADVAQTNAEVISAAESLGEFASLSEADIFDVEYWSLEQAKLGKSTARRLAGYVVAITGGGGTIGSATARGFAREGAEVVVLDSDMQAALTTAKAVQGLALTCDVTDRGAVAGAMDSICRRYGGLDVLVSNAGSAITGTIGTVDDATLRRSFELNFFAHQTVAQAAVAIMLRQKTGGVLLFNASKQALNPGPDFGPYGVPKAAVVALAKQYAIDYGAARIRANVVNADRIRSGLLTGQMIAERAAARSLSEAQYMGGNLLGLEVRPEDVAEAFVTLALAERTTAAIVTVDGGNVAASVR